MRVIELLFLKTSLFLHNLEKIYTAMGTLLELFLQFFSDQNQIRKVLVWIQYFRVSQNHKSEQKVSHTSQIQSLRLQKERAEARV